MGSFDVGGDYREVCRIGETAAVGAAVGRSSDRFSMPLPLDKRALRKISTTMVKRPLGEKKRMTCCSTLVVNGERPLDIVYPLSVTMAPRLTGRSATVGRICAAGTVGGQAHPALFQKIGSQ